MAFDPQCLIHSVSLQIRSNVIHTITNHHMHKVFPPTHCTLVVVHTHTHRHTHKYYTILYYASSTVTPVPNDIKVILKNPLILTQKQILRCENALKWFLCASEHNIRISHQFPSPHNMQQHNSTKVIRVLFVQHSMMNQEKSFWLLLCSFCGPIIIHVSRKKVNFNVQIIEVQLVPILQYLYPN